MFGLLFVLEMYVQWRLRRATQQQNSNNNHNSKQ